MADQKITELTALTAPLDDDILPIVNDPGGSPVTKKVTLSKISSPRILATVTGINAKTIATTTLYTVPSGKSLVLTMVNIRCTAFTAGDKSTQAVCSVGCNATDYDDFVTGGDVTVAAVNKGWSIYVGQTSNVFTIYVATSVLTLNITTGSDATTETWAVDVIGYLV